MNHTALAVDMRGIVKRFPGVLALAGLDFQAAAGEIHALVGENGAGKSTLMSVLAGRLVPDEGSISLGGKTMPPGSPKAAIKAGLGMVYQHFKLIPSLSVAENLLLGWQHGGLKLNRTQLEERISELGRRFNLEVSPKAKLWQLSMGERQRVEILRLLLLDAKVLVFDEPTTILTPLETKDLFQALKKMRDQGRTVIFISHKLDEVLDLADSITVLRRGKRVETLERNCADEDTLARLMMAADWQPLSYDVKQASESAEPPLFKLQGVSAKDDQGLLRLADIDLELPPGQILGVAGVAGNGQPELAEICSGAKKPCQGSITLMGQELAGYGPHRFTAAGVGYVPEDRQHDGSIASLNLVENMLLKHYRGREFGRGLWLDWAAAQQFTSAMIQKYDIRPAAPQATAESLSGGNLQKLLLARELAKKPKLLIAAYPLRGLDLASANFVEKTLRNYADQGGAVLLISEDLEYLRNISDRIMVLFRGRNMGVFANRELDLDRVGLLMAGREAVS